MNLVHSRLKLINLFGERLKQAIKAFLIRCLQCLTRRGQQPLPNDLELGAQSGAGFLDPLHLRFVVHSSLCQRCGLSAQLRFER